jgi:hypothetical protein
MKQKHIVEIKEDKKTMKSKYTTGEKQYIYILQPTNTVTEQFHENKSNYMLSTGD